MWDNPQQLDQLTKALRLLLVFGLLYAAFAFVQQSDWVPVKAVKVEGDLRYLTREQVELVVENSVEGNFFAVDLERIHHAFESLPWVEHVGIKRDWKSRMVVVSLGEHQPFASWGNVSLLSTKGELFDAVVNQPLPVLFGPENAERNVFDHYKQLSQLLKTVDLTIAKLTLSPRFAWQLTTNDGMTVEIGSAQQVMPTMRKFIKVYQNSIGEWSGKIDYVDLRYKDGFAIRKPSEGSAAVLSMAKGEI